MKKLSAQTQARVFLASLGDTPSKIARHLAGRVTGQRGHRRGCPLYHALRLAVPSATCVRVLPGSIVINNRSIRPPKAVDQFIERFDDGRYPDLDVNTTR
jgi:hypothetical protein